MLSPHVFCFETAGSQCIEMVLCTIAQLSSGGDRSAPRRRTRAPLAWAIGDLSCRPRRRGGGGRRHSDSPLFTTLPTIFVNSSFRRKCAADAGPRRRSRDPFRPGSRRFRAPLLSTQIMSISEWLFDKIWPEFAMFVHELSFRGKMRNDGWGYVPRR